MVAQEFLNGRFDDPGAWFYDTLLMLPAIIIGLSFHEFGHAVTAYMLGDNTPKLQGRVTVNPRAHVDVFGFICLLFAGFGWGVPVMIDPRNFKHPRRDELIVSAAGVVMNLLLAILTAFIIKFAGTAIMGLSLGTAIFQILINIIAINLVLMVFNLIPVPPLDGFGIITEIFNLKRTEFYYKIYDKGLLILMILIVFNITGKIISPIVNFLYALIMNYIVFA